MHRRQFIKAASTVASLSFAGAATNTLLAADSNGGRAPNRVAVIGAGIVGASIAWHLSKRGCEVIVIEKRSPAAQASGNSFAWFNASYVKLPFSYHLLSSYSVQEYARLSLAVDFPKHQGGSLEWADTDSAQQQIADGVAGIQKFGSPTWMIGPGEAMRLEPHVEFGSATQVARSEADGAIDPKATTLALLADAVRLGAEMHFPALLRNISATGDSVLVDTDDGSFEVDRVVVAAGIGTSEIAKGLGLRLEQRPTPGFIVTTAPMNRLINGVVIAPGVHLHQRTDGRVILGEQGGPPNTDEHAAYLKERPNNYPAQEIALQHAERLLTIARKFVPALADAKVEHVGIGWRPMPMDGLPIIGRSRDVPGVHFAVMHSGVTLAPIVGRLTAMEILDDVRVELLSDFRPERF